MREKPSRLINLQKAGVQLVRQKNKRANKEDQKTNPVTIATNRVFKDPPFSVTSNSSWPKSVNLSIPEPPIFCDGYFIATICCICQQIYF